MRTILVPTDFSETANHALEVAVQLVKRFNAKLVVLHMLEIPEHLLPKEQLSNDVANNQNTEQGDFPTAVFYMLLAKKRFAELAELPFMNGVEYEEEVQNHQNFNNIIVSAHKFDADLIVMGSQGATGINEFFVGSNTEKVVRTSDIPVLVIKNRNQNFDVKNFVFATNWETENKQSFINAYKICQQFGAKMHLLYVNTSGSDFLTSTQIDDRFQTLLKETNTSPENISTNSYSDKSIEEGILRFSKENSADLIGIPTHGRRGLAHFFNRSVGEGIANHAEIPVITFKIDNV